MSIELLGRDIPLYGLFFWLGIFFAALAAIFVCRRLGLPLFDLACSAVYTVIAGIVGAKLLYIAVAFQDIVAFAKENEIGFIKLVPMLIKGGFVFYGGLIGGFFGLAIYTIKFKMDPCAMFQVYAVVLPLGHAFGRVGCFLGGCCYGVAYNGFLAYTYEIATGAAPVGVPLLPIQLIEALLLLLLFGVQVILLLAYPTKKTLPICNYAFSYSIIRFVLEFFRGDKERGMLLRFSTSQWISTAVFLVTFAYFVRKKKGENIAERKSIP